MAKKDSISPNPPKELSGITTEPERFHLRVQLTEKEMLQAAKNSASAFIEVQNLEDQLSGIKAKFKSDIEAQQLKMKKSSMLVEDGYEYRDVECEWRKDWGKGLKSCTRLDTGEIIKVDMKIEPSERQSALSMVENVKTIETK